MLGASPGEVYNLVAREARVPRVVLASCKVGRPTYNQWLLPPHYAPSRGGTLVTHAYIKEST